MSVHQSVILLVEDEVMLRSMVKQWLEKNGYQVFTAGDTEEAERALEEHQPNLMMLDIRLPRESGIDFLERIRSKWPDLGVVISTAVDETTVAVRAMKLGAYDYIVKPFSLQTCLMAVKGAEERWRLRMQAKFYQHELEEKVIERTRAIESVRDTSVFLLAKLAQSRDDETGMHLERMRFYTDVLAKELVREGFTEIDDDFLQALYRASPLHDIGKVGIPDAILLKPASLTREEFEVMKRHTVLGADCLKDAMEESEAEGRFLEMGYLVARHHHENFDGTGYPDGLQQDNIPLSARIVAVADFYDAMVFPRVYRPTSMPHDQVVDLMTELSGRKFDPRVLAGFLKIQYNFKDIAARLID